MESNETTKTIRIMQLIQYLGEYPPKTILRMSQMLQVSNKSIYRYLDVLRQIGYEIAFDQKKRYYIKYPESSKKLNEEEKKYVVSLLKSIPQPSSLSSTIIEKLKISEYLPTPKSLTTLRKLQLIHQLFYSIENGKLIKLINYRGVSNASTDADREIFPVYFDENRLSVTGFDIHKQGFRIFKLARMENLEIIEKQVDLTIPIAIPHVDIFGFGGNREICVDLKLTRRAKSLLSEEYPLSESKIMNNPNDKTFPFNISLNVSGYEGVGRFVLGLCNEIKVTGDDGFIKYLHKKLNNNTLNV